MANSSSASQGSASFWTQANALLRKNLTFQKRNMKTNITLILFPLILCVVLVVLQNVINKELDNDNFKCGCKIIDKGNGRSERVCGIEYSDQTQALSCPIRIPIEWPSILQVPDPSSRAVTNSTSFTGLPNSSCRKTQSCPVTFLFTGQNQTFGESLAGKVFTDSIYYNSSDIQYSLAKNVLGSYNWDMDVVNFVDPAFVSSYDVPLYYLQSRCSSNVTLTVPIQIGSVSVTKKIICLEGHLVRHNSSAEIKDELYKGFKNRNMMAGAYDFLNSNLNNFNVSVWHNGYYRRNAISKVELTRVHRAVNLISNTFLQLLRGPSTEMLLEFIKEMPKPKTRFSPDYASLLGPLFFSWVILQLFPVILSALVYEKQQRLRIIMKMHGLGDGPYWMITYGYFLLLSTAYMLCFVLFGSVIGLKFFTANAYSIQFVFYFIFINLLIAFAILVAAMFSNVKTVTVIGYILVFSSGLLGEFLFSYFVKDPSFPGGWIIVMELYPGFSLYRGLFEFSQYAFSGSQTDSSGMRWVNLSDRENGTRDVLIIMMLEWIVVLFVAYYIDQVVSSGIGVGRSPLYFLERFRKNSTSSVSRKTSLEAEGSEVLVEMDKPDIAQEKGKVVQLLKEPSSHAIICDNLKKTYPGRDGNPEKHAVRGVSLALPQGECFGLLGPNGAGKTSFINMMIGLMKPSSGAAYVNGLDIRTHMNEIYSSMGVCPQKDLLWESLTGREHLLFYGRLKKLKGADLTHAVEESLRSVNLSGVADKYTGKYSGGMKRKLSVAISLIGDPKVVYMDEPSTGLDPASRNSLWSVLKRAKQDRAIILTTHSMEEAEHLCDRLGIFVDGSLQCIGNPKELKARYGGSYIFTMTTSPDHEEQVDNMVRNLSPNANKVYHLSGTQKFELPKQEVRIADVFKAVEMAKSRFVVHAWGLADTTLEDVFIKVARGAQSSNVLS